MRFVIEDGVPVPRAPAPYAPGSQNPTRDQNIVNEHVHARRTLQDIGDDYGLTRERVRQIVRRAGVSPKVTAAVKHENAVERVLFVCEVCGKKNLLKPAVARTRRVCSHECSGKLRRAYTHEDLLDHLRDLALELGCTPGVNDVIAHDGPSHTMYYRYFGSLRAAQAEAGLKPNKVGGREGRNPLEESGVALSM